MRRRLTASTSKSDLVFYSVSETGDVGVAYTYTMNYFKHLLSQAIEETVVEPIRRAPQFIHSMKFPEQEGPQPVDAFPTTRRLWNGRRGIMTIHRRDPEPVIFNLIPDAEGDMQTLFDRPERRVQTTVSRHSVHLRSQVDGDIRFLSAIGRAMKNAVWVEQRGTPRKPTLCLATWPGEEPDTDGVSPTQTRVIEWDQEVFGDWADTATALHLDDFYGILSASTRNGEVFLMYFS
jgi:hypothetical protein